MGPPDIVTGRSGHSIIKIPTKMRGKNRNENTLEIFREDKIEMAIMPDLKLKPRTNPEIMTKMAEINSLNSDYTKQ